MLSGGPNWEKSLRKQKSSQATISEEEEDSQFGSRFLICFYTTIMSNKNIGHLSRALSQLDSPRKLT